MDTDERERRAQAQFDAIYKQKMAEAEARRAAGLPPHSAPVDEQARDDVTSATAHQQFDTAHQPPIPETPTYSPDPLDLVQRLNAEQKQRISPTRRRRDADEAARAYAGEVYDIISSGGDITEAYGIADSVRLGWAQLVEASASIPGARRCKGAVERERTHIEERILASEISRFRKDFGAVLRVAQNRQLYLRERLEQYSLDETRAMSAWLACDTKAISLRDAISGLELDISVGASTARSGISTDAGRDITDRRHNKRMGCVTLTELTGDAERHCREAIVSLIQFAEMQTQYVCVYKMVNLILERGKYIDQVLTDYQAGANIRDTALLQRQLEECGLIKRRLSDLNGEYESLERGMLRASSLPISELYDALEQAKRRLRESQMTSVASVDQLHRQGFTLAFGVAPEDA